MDNLACPLCKSSKYRNPSFKLMVNVCGHTLCESCVDLLFLKGSGSCPDCMEPLRRNNFRVQFFEDPRVEKEVAIRRKILCDYNKTEEDFGTLKEYNDYLEEIETIVFNLLHKIDVVNTIKRIEAYRRENRDVTQRNKARIGREEYELQEMLKEERAHEEARRQELLVREIEQKKKKEWEKEALVDELMTSARDPKAIVNEFVEKVEKRREEEKKMPPPKPTTEFSTGIKFGRSAEKMFLPLPVLDDGPLYEHEIPMMYMEGPQAPPAMDIERKGFIKHVKRESGRENGGGFHASLACQRALQEAMQGLYRGTTTGN